MHRNLQALLVLVALLPVAWGTRTLRVRGMDHFQDRQTYDDVYYLPPPGFLKVASLGYDEALADLIWMRALIYFGEEFKREGEVRHVFRYGDAMLALDPRFKRVYSWIGTASMYTPRGVGPDVIERAAGYLERATRIWPDDGDLAWDAGATFSYELAPHLEDPEAKERALRRGAEHMMAAARLGSGPEWLALANARQLQRLGALEQAASHLEDVFLGVRDPVARARIEQRIAELRSQAEAEAVRRTVEELQAEQEASYPYLPTTLFLLVGPRGVVDEAQLLRDRFLVPWGDLGAGEGEGEQDDEGEGEGATDGDDSDAEAPGDPAPAPSPSQPAPI